MRAVALLIAAGLAASATGARAAEDPSLRPRAWEAGVAAATSTIAGNTQGVFSLRVATFLSAPGGLASVQLETSYSHVSSLDELGFEVAAGWTPSQGQILPFVALAAGVRQEWVGSFREARYPVGVDLGVRLLLSSRVGLRGEYRYRRVLDDPVADFNEHRFVMGLSVFWKNEG